MHNSIIIFLGLLTFLIPVGSSISNSNALAFSDYGYQDDQYEKYANDMINKNYYKSQSNDFIKKIKCNNINSNFNGIEANISTDDSLGILGTESQDDASANWFGNGQRNNGNFDLDCINNNNNEGGQGGGATGPQGPQGEQGPPGIASLDASNYYSVVGNVASPDPDTDFANSTAVCRPGDVAISGEYNVTNQLPGNLIRFLSFGSLGPDPPTNWSTQMILGDEDMTVITTVNCFDNSPSSTLAAASNAVSPVQQQSEASSIMSQEIDNSPKLTTLEKQTAEDSTELTATEKITKLKQQWMELTQ